MKSKFFLLMFFLAISNNVLATNGIYILLEGGYSKYLDMPSASRVNAVNVHSPSFPSAARAAVGYNHDWRPHIGLGLELGVGRLGETVYRFPTRYIGLQVKTLEFLNVGQIHIQAWDIFTKVGGIRETLVYSNQRNQTTINPIWTLGFAYNFNCHVAATGEYVRIFGHGSLKNINENELKGIAVNEYLAGFRYIFG